MYSEGSKHSLSLLESANYHKIITVQNSVRKDSLGSASRLVNRADSVKESQLFFCQKQVVYINCATHLRKNVEHLTALLSNKSLLIIFIFK